MFKKKHYQPYSEAPPHGHLPIQFFPKKCPDYEILFAYAKGFLIGKGMIEEFNKAMDEFGSEIPPPSYIVPSDLKIEKEIK
ncbi:MAG: hypothetical protein KBC72_00435 [Acinetobacter sp.]|nr:hypothetical protein [Acinetobacter sp.]